MNALTQREEYPSVNWEGHLEWKWKNYNYIWDFEILLIDYHFDFTLFIVTSLADFIKLLLSYLLRELFLEDFFRDLIIHKFPFYIINRNDSLKQMHCFISNATWFDLKLFVWKNFYIRSSLTAATATAANLVASERRQKSFRKKLSCLETRLVSGTMLIVPKGIFMEHHITPFIWWKSLHVIQFLMQRGRVLGIRPYYWL